ncbi:MAG: CYTH domain-containing protein [Cyclobacteriaceae bacterium]|nr:CYTH domain-containing protein [Cyclobacteriaceae bacterium]
MQKMNYRDFTLKARLYNSQKIKGQLLKLGARCVGTDNQVDRYFEIAQGKLKWRQGNIENLITHYERIQEDGLEQTVVYRYDVNPSQETIQQLFDLYQVASTVSKQRTIYWLGNVKIHVDKLPDGSEFIELEAMDRNDKLSTAELKTQCKQIQQALAIEDSDLLPTGYFQ